MAPNYNHPLRAAPRIQDGRHSAEGCLDANDRKGWEWGASEGLLDGSPLLNMHQTHCIPPRETRLTYLLLAVVHRCFHFFSPRSRMEIVLLCFSPRAYPFTARALEIFRTLPVEAYKLRGCWIFELCFWWTWTYLPLGQILSESGRQRTCMVWLETQCQLEMSKRFQEKLREYPGCLGCNPPPYFSQ